MRSAVGDELQRSRATCFSLFFGNDVLQIRRGGLLEASAAVTDNALPMVQVRLMKSLGDFYASAYLSSHQ